MTKLMAMEEERGGLTIDDYVTTAAAAATPRRNTSRLEPLERPGSPMIHPSSTTCVVPSRNKELAGPTTSIRHRTPSSLHDVERTATMTSSSQTSRDLQQNLHTFYNKKVLNVFN